MRLTYYVFAGLSYSGATFFLCNCVLSGKTEQFWHSAACAGIASLCSIAAELARRK